MNIYGLLRDEHDVQRELARCLRHTPAAGRERLWLWETFEAEVASHARAEAQTFYAALQAHPEGRDLALDGAREHAEAAALIGELSASAVATSRWMRTFDELERLLTQHMDEEEDLAFAVALRVLDEAEEARLVRRYRAVKAASPVRLAQATTSWRRVAT